MWRAAALVVMKVVRAAASTGCGRRERPLPPRARTPAPWRCRSTLRLRRSQRSCPRATRRTSWLSVRSYDRVEPRNSSGTRLGCWRERGGGAARTGRPLMDGTLAVTGATLDGEAVGLRAEDGRIAELGPDVTAREGDEGIDAPGMALVPGRWRSASTRTTCTGGRGWRARR